MTNGDWRAQSLGVSSCSDCLMPPGLLFTQSQTANCPLMLPAAAPLLTLEPSGMSWHSQVPRPIYDGLVACLLLGHTDNTWRAGLAGRSPLHVPFPSLARHRLSTEVFKGVSEFPKYFLFHDLPGSSPAPGHRKQAIAPFYR